MEGKPTREVNRGDGDCVAGGSESTSCTSTGKTPGVKMYQLQGVEAVGQKFIKFVERHRPSCKKPSYSCTLPCSAHFEDTSDFRPHTD